MKILKIVETNATKFSVEVDVTILVGESEREITRRMIIELPIEDLEIVEQLIEKESVNT